MTRYITEHKGDPERTIRFISQYCEVWKSGYNIYVREYFKDMTSSLDRHKYIYANDDSCDTGATLEVLPTDIYVPFEEVEGRRRL